MSTDASCAMADAGNPCPESRTTVASLAEHLPLDNRSDREKLGRHQLLPLFKRELGGAAEELVGIMYCGWHECSESGVDHEDRSFGTSTSRSLWSVLVERTYCEGCNRSSEWRIPDWCEHVWYKRIGDGEHFIPKSWNDSDHSALTRPHKVLLAQYGLLFLDARHVRSSRTQARRGPTDRLSPSLSPSLPPPST